jgi:3-(3-hydroxy-phenyl)propionate hydroxylase
VALAGDAMHIHSPIGARGMNLGIEDAYVYAGCAADALAGRRDAIDNYAKLWHPVHKTVVGRMDYLTILARGTPEWVGLMRRYLFPTMAGFGPVTRLMRKFLTGLDHPVESL